MTPPHSITLTDPEVALIRRALLHVQHQQRDIISGEQPIDVIVGRLGEAVAGIEYLLARAEQRRDGH